ncbi:hypothetical protein Q1695_001486 [Nippostrongylus brasiliensis]|nr:hypothetical protein Q1695_001486 [Nippostrongylus brasiliensis]
MELNEKFGEKLGQPEADGGRKAGAACVQPTVFRPFVVVRQKRYDASHLAIGHRVSTGSSYIRLTHMTFCISSRKTASAEPISSLSSQMPD